MPKGEEPQKQDKAVHLSIRESMSSLVLHRMKASFPTCTTEEEASNTLWNQLFSIFPQYSSSEGSMGWLGSLKKMSLIRIDCILNMREFTERDSTACSYHTIQAIATDVSS